MVLRVPLDSMIDIIYLIKGDYYYLMFVVVSSAKIMRGCEEGAGCIK